MKIKCSWQDKMHFTAAADEFKIEMDASPPLGKNAGPTPKQLLLAGICGCTGMDVAALLRKHKQSVTSLVIESHSESTEGKHPAVFKFVKLTFKVQGEVDPDKLIEAVKLSQTQYCGVSAMVSKVVPISYEIELNGKNIGEGKADFKV